MAIWVRQVLANELMFNRWGKRFESGFRYVTKSTAPRADQGFTGGGSYPPNEGGSFDLPTPFVEELSPTQGRGHAPLCGPFTEPTARLTGLQCRPDAYASRSG